MAGTFSFRNDTNIIGHPQRLEAHLLWTFVCSELAFMWLAHLLILEGHVLLAAAWTAQSGVHSLQCASMR